MHLREEKTFTDDEVIAALALIVSAEEARVEGIALNSVPDCKGFEFATPAELAAAPVSGPRSYDGDFLDLVSLVSESCATRAWALMGISISEGVKRRELFRLRIQPALQRGHTPKEQ